MPRHQDTNSGKFTQQYADEDFLRALDDHGQATSSDVAEVVGCSDKYAYVRLRELEDEDRVTSRTVGKAKLWERTAGVDGVNPADPFWDTAGMVSSEEGNLSQTVDEELYGPVETPE